MVNTGPVMFSGEIYYTDSSIQLTKSLVKHSFCNAEVGGGRAGGRQLLVSAQ